MSSGFFDYKLTYDNLDRYHIRKSIKNAIDFNLKFFKGSLLDVGCGKMPYKDYILSKSNVNEYLGLDIETALVYDVGVKPDFTWNGELIPFEDNVFNTVIATEVLEHCPNPDLILKEVYRVLKNNSYFFFTVPFLWNLHEVPHDEYRYTPFSLERHLKGVGFTEISISAMGGWHSSMAQMLGLWVCRSAMTSRKRKWLKRFLKPVIRYLLLKDKVKNINFNEGQMITGLYGIAKKQH